MKLVLVFLSAAVLLTVSSAATFQRPVDSTSSVIEQTTPVTEPQTTPVTEVQPQTTPVTEPQTTPVTEVQPQTTPVTEPQTTPVTEVQPQTTPVTEPQTTPVTEVQPPINELQELEIDKNKEDLDPVKIIEEEINNEEEDELHCLLKADEERFIGFFDAYVGLNEVHERNQLESVNKQGLRRKRWVPLAIGGRIAFTAGRAFLSRYARRGITKSGRRITKHYSRKGNYFSGLREFKNLKPTNVKRIGGSKFKGWTGTSGPYRVTVRSGSKGRTGTKGSPTLSISSKNGKLVRKFRFE